MPQSEECQRGGHRQAGYIEAYFYLRIANSGDIGKLPGEQVGRDYRQTAAVGQRNPYAQDNVAKQEPHNAPWQAVRQDVYPHFMNVEQYSENESHNEAEQVGRDEFLPHYHQRQHKQTLENVSPGAEGQRREHLRKRIRDAGYRGDSRRGIQHEHHSEAVYRDRQRKCKFAAKKDFFF